MNQYLGFPLYLALLAGTVIVSTAAGQQSLTLVKDGKPVATIVLSDKPTSAAQLAAYELQWHLQQMSGATLPIVQGDAKVDGVRILVGESAETKALNLPNTPFAMQEYLVQFLPDTLVIMGKDKADFGKPKYDPDRWYDCWNTFPDFWEEKGTLNATYDFLEQYCGVRWFDPTETGTVIPKSKTVTVKGSELRRKPFMSTRFAALEGVAESYDNAIGLWSAGTPEYTAYEEAAFANLHKQFTDPNQYILAKRAKMRLYLLRLRAGGEKSLANHSMYNIYDRYWKDHHLQSGHHIFVEHRPELFAKGYEGEPPQLCYTNPELIKIIREDAQNYFDHAGYPGPDAGSGVWPGYHWGENYFAVEPMDNSLFCGCENCRQFAHGDTEHTNVYSSGVDSDYFFNFVNEIAKGVKIPPGKRIVTLAYGSHAWPPKTVKLDPSVGVFFCYSANRQVYNIRDTENELAALKAWRTEDPDRPLYLWLYNCFPMQIADNGKFHCFPGFFAHAVGNQFKLFKQYNIRGIFFCGFGNQVEAYLSYKMMDDPTLKVDTVLNEYFTGLYGKAAKPMRTLYEGIEAAYCNPKNYPEEIATGVRGSHQTAQFAWERLGTTERMAGFQKLLDQAKAQATTETEKTNVDLFEKATWSYMTSGRATYVKRMHAPIPAVRAAKVDDAGGDVTHVDWAKANPLGDQWCDRGGETPSKRKLAGRICHDSRYVYLELTDPCNTARLNAAPDVCPYDDWEIFLAGARALPYRHLCFGPTELMFMASDGEVNWRMNVPVQDHGVKSKSEKQPDKWVSRMAIPLKSITAAGIAPDGKFYMNIIRVTSPEINGGGGLGIDTWVSYCTVHEVDRLAEIDLE